MNNRIDNTMRKVRNLTVRLLPSRSPIMLNRLAPRLSRISRSIMTMITFIQSMLGAAENEGAILLEQGGVAI